MSTDCLHRRRLWVLSPGPRVACSFGFCDDCGRKLSIREIEQAVKEVYPDRPVQRSLLDWATDSPEPDGWQLACARGWVRFLYPGKLVGALMDALPANRKVEFYRSWLDD